MANKKIQSLLYRPEHKSNVLAAMADFNNTHQDKPGRKRGYHSTIHKRKQRRFETKNREKLF
jgi:hypothetical protein